MKVPVIVNNPYGTGDNKSSRSKRLQTPSPLKNPKPYRVIHALFSASAAIKNLPEDHQDNGTYSITQPLTRKRRDLCDFALIERIEFQAPFATLTLA
jgi:hypothetical protein